MKANRGTREQQGAAMVEFVFVLPLLIVILFSIVQFGLVINRVQTFNAAAREGARTASVQKDQTQIKSAVSGTLDGLSLGITETVSITPNLGRPCEGRSGQTVTVDVSGPYLIEIPLIPNINVTLRGTGVFRCE